MIIIGRPPSPLPLRCPAGCAFCDGVAFLPQQTVDPSPALPSPTLATKVRKSSWLFLVKEFLIGNEE